MIIYGLTMQGKPEAVPKEVTTWLLERNSRYPDIDFIIDCWDPHPSQVEEFETAARKYSRLYSFNGPLGGVGQILFPYLSQSWSVKIVGGLDKKGEIADKSDPNYLENFGGPLPVALRADIVALPDFSTLEKVSDKVMAVPRKENEPVLNAPEELVSLPSDFKMTSEFSLSGEEIEKFAQYVSLLLEPDIQKEAERAIRAKDWETLKRLQSRNRN